MENIFDLPLPGHERPPAIVTGMISAADKIPLLLEGARLANAECGVEDRYVLTLLPAAESDSPDQVRYCMKGSWLKRPSGDCSDFWKQVRVLEAAEVEKPETMSTE